jgi:hypothetical protein
MSNMRITWTFPTNRVLGEALPLAQIKHAEISMSADGGENFSGVAQVAPEGPTGEHLIADIAPGTYIVRVVVVDTEDRRSAAVDATGGVLSDPSPVSDLVVTIE